MEAIWPWPLVAIFAAFMIYCVHERDRAHRLLHECRDHMKGYGWSRHKADLLADIEKELTGVPHPHCK